MENVLVLILLILALVFSAMRAFGWGSERPHFGWLGFACFVGAALVGAF